MGMRTSSVKLRSQKLPPPPRRCFEARWAPTRILLPIPSGFRPTSQGCGGRPLPWESTFQPTPPGLRLSGSVCQPFPHGFRHDTTPVGLMIPRRPCPKVASSSQPWALGHNPVGIGGNSFGIDSKTLDPTCGSGTTAIACWFIDTDYNEESFFVRHAYFLGANDPYNALETTLKTEINQEAWATLNSDTSRSF